VNLSGKTVKIEELIRPGVEALGYELWGLDHQSQGRHTLLRVYIDSENGIGVDDCAKVSHQISGVLDVEDPIAGEYNLEVSSPGMDRPLYTLEQYAQYIGSDISVRLRIPFEGRRKFLGRLTGIEDGDVVLTAEEHEYLLPFDQIDKANVVPRF
jgi:ribosome maturation factor RimP|tara:strand:+ start:30224 stop:30685 length:462 start_codon:yes stop_codon:yes gene_type:complete